MSLLSVGALAAAFGHQQLVRFDRDTRDTSVSPLQGVAVPGEWQAGNICVLQREATTGRN